ncbi:MAG TPA: SLBB domain-containing protein [Candidatus Krumholzibacteria bacterium]|nr:SLBB domain-containing protein [Candidatus Krumholzibacteria bacterium]
MTGSKWCALARVSLLAGMLLLVAVVAGAQDPAQYKIGTEDVIRIVVGTRTDLTALVRADGKVVFAGEELQAAGLTPRQLGIALTERNSIRQPGAPPVIVEVLQCNSRKVTVSGEVRTPGTFPLCSIPDLWTLLTKDAGGLTAIADLSRVQILRAEGEPKLVLVDLSTAPQGKIPKNMPEVRPRDTITVPSLAAEATTVTGSSFQILGSVRNPGVYPLSRAGTVMDALGVAGGHLPEANLKKVALTRNNGDSVVAYKLNLQALLYEGETGANFDLQSGDTVTIPTKSFGPGTVARGLVILLPLITSITTLIVVAR